MQDIIPAVDPRLLKAELNDSTFLRRTNNGNNEIYVINWENAPNTLREIGRLREITFRDAGGGTYKETDIDNYDLCEEPFQQLIVWNPRDEEIVGGYRFKLGKYLKLDEKGYVQSPSGKLFRFSERFINEFLPNIVELGRSFVQPNYQPSNNIRSGMYSLDNLWDGLGAIVVDNPEIHYFFGKFTMYPHYNPLARNLILYFLNYYFPDKDALAEPFDKLKTAINTPLMQAIFTGSSYEENYKILVREVRALKENIPPLVNAYMNLSSTMRTFGTAVNRGFGDAEETGILVTIGDIYEKKKIRHLDTYKPENPD
ncbi:MAG: GNAT family N-acetyltransferase [Bacteroidales bacterium]|nr:GNAT family N-acetyltransferase [Bacteroidales bacterium]MDZ4204629.1 GNAT family N-acetyltransferase [Bacteroidales bacterium]